MYRRCGCRDERRRQLGVRCPRLVTDPGHGRWSFAVDVFDPGRRRATVRRGGFSGREEARVALRRFLAGEEAGFRADPNETVADYLTGWPAAKEMSLKPTTYARHRDYVRNDHLPRPGRVRLDDPGYGHIAAFARDQPTRGRGRVTVHRCLATLSSALGEAVRHHRLPANPARPTVIPRPAAAERRVWTVEEAARFLVHRHAHDRLFADLVEVLIGTGMRKGEALGRRWADVHLDQGVLLVRCILSAVDNNHLVPTTPKTRSSRGWIALSDRVAQALRRRAAARGAEGGSQGGPVFHRADGRPLHPQYALNHFHLLRERAGVPRIALHDLRHLTATNFPHRRRAAGDRVQDAAALHPVDHRERLRSPDRAGRPPGRGPRRPGPRRGRTGTPPAGCDHPATTVGP